MEFARGGGGEKKQTYSHCQFPFTLRNNDIRGITEDRSMEGGGRSNVLL